MKTYILDESEREWIIRAAVARIEKKIVNCMIIASVFVLIFLFFHNRGLI